MQPYVDEGWTFVAVQLNAVGQTLEGDLPPIAMTFATDQRSTRCGCRRSPRRPSTPTVYVLAGHRMERTDPVA